jgi:hypothetical protein
VGFLGLRKAAWKHEDAQRRLAAIQELTYDQQRVFIALAGSDPDARVRAAATRRITDQASLQALLTSSDPEVVRLAREKLSSVAVDLALKGDLASCRPLLEAIQDQKSLAELSLSAADAAMREAAFARLLAFTEPSPAMLALIAVQDASGALALRALERIAKRGLLKDISRKAKHEGVRTAAAERERLLEAEQAKPSAEQSRKARLRALEPLVADAARLSLSNDWERVAAALSGLERQRCEVLDAHAELPLDEAARALDDRFQRALRESAARRQESIDKAAALIAARAAFLDGLAGELPGDAAGVAERRQQLQARWGALAGAPANPADQRRFEEQIARLCTAVAAAAAGQRGEDGYARAMEPSRPVVELDTAASAELETLSAEAEGLIEAPDWRTAQDRYRLLHKRWSMLTAGVHPGHPLKARFLDAYERFKDRRREARTQRDAVTRERIDRLAALVAEAEALAAAVPAEQELRGRFERIRQLQADWKAVGALRLELIQGLRTRFRTACDAAYVPVRALHEAEDWERFAHFAKAEELIARVEALQENTEFAAVARAVKQAQADWKLLGPLPRDRREAAWGRFRAACDAQFTRCQPYFAELDAQRLANLEQKLALVAEAERLAGQGPIGLAGSPADLADKRVAWDRFKVIQQEWRDIGPVPRERDQEVWTRFRTACDAFFARHRAELDARHQEQVENLTQKTGLCVAVEELATECEEMSKLSGGAIGGRFQHARMSDPEERLRAVKELQSKWKSFGHVPREQVETIWTRFRTACDRVYATCKEHLDKRENERQENLAKKQAIISEAEELLKHENARWFRDDLKELQRQWKEIGHVPRENMDELMRRFQEVSDKIYAL